MFHGPDLSYISTCCDVNRPLERWVFTVISINILQNTVNRRKCGGIIYAQSKQREKYQMTVHMYSGPWCCLSFREWGTALEREHCLPLCHAPDDLAQATVTKIWLYCACYSWVSVLQTSTGQELTCEQGKACNGVFHVVLLTNALSP